MRRASPLLAIVAGLALVVLAFVISCGGRMRPPPTPTVRDARVQEIAALWTQIRQWRKEGRMARLEPSAARKFAMRYKTSRQAAGVCPDHPQPKTPKCQDVCSLAHNICQNSEAICRIADELGDDSWAKEKCNSAKASCNEAKKRCCKCVGPLGS